MIIELPFPPSINHYYGTRICGRRAIRFIASEGKRFREEVITFALLTRAQYRLQGPLKSTVTLYPPDHRRRDLDNFAGKALYDALTHANVYGDDSQVREQHHKWGPVIYGGKCVIELVPLIGEQSEHNQLDMVS